ncbi:Hypothetical protein MLC_6310 [Mycoplasma mycoides subsp. capri LC str. 95010]|uniref:Chromosome partition protein Smc n=1 Tax=Mycoplasma mycoides subsp. capri LC str. 95010 TaxID=862259 RepID=F4MQH6_MYCML|nr:hypothetical protein [Mycoplasma mycoides]CBW54359.1 Hypothetical protein MLC_6310 [Mycoplasma mycoides subsp. capri LC str. 95010]
MEKSDLLLTRTKTSLEIHLTRLSRKINDLKSSNEDLLTTKNNLEIQKKRLENDLLSTKNEILSVNKKINEIELEKKELKEKLDEVIFTNKVESDAFKELEESKKQIKQLKEQEEKLKTDITNLTKENKILERKYKELNNFTNEIFDEKYLADFVRRMQSLSSKIIGKKNVSSKAKLWEELINLKMELYKKSIPNSFKEMWYTVFRELFLQTYNSNQR